ncbi:MAG TPA: FecR domain-containing protein [Opitutaceae bacterium]|jgi:hypothetical protein|nr:FecR domain-containing protein [Opitutaceae bacterium]
MKKPFFVCLYLGSILFACICPAADLKQSKFTQVVNDVRVISAVDNFEQPAVVNAVFHMPDLVRTGDASRAELVAADDTITRVGANTVFSFDPANRTIDLQQGSLLFHSPKGKGGGTIHTGSATASVLGTTIIVTTTHNGGFKVIDLEGHVAIKFLNGLRQSLNPGQMTFVLPGGHPAPVINIRLDKLTHDSKLVQGFVVPLPSMPLIQQQIDDQIKLIQSGQAQDTGLLVGDVATTTTVQVVDSNTIKDHDDESTTSGGDTTGGDTTTGGGTTTPPLLGPVISGPTLPSQYIHPSPFTLADGTVFPAGFIAPNITISTPKIDLSPYSSDPEFAFVAEDPNTLLAASTQMTSDASTSTSTGTLVINGSVDFTGLSSTAILDLYANTFSFASGSTIEADVGFFDLYPQTATTLSNVAILNKAASGDIVVFSPAAFSLTNGSSVNAAGIAELFSDSTVTLNNATVQGSSVDLFGSTGISIVGGSTVTATGGNLSIADGGGINISGATLNAIAGPTIGDSSSGDVDIAAIGDVVNISNGTSITAANQLSLASDTGVSISGASNLNAGGSLEIITDETVDAPISVTGNSTLTSGFESNMVLQAGTDLTVNGATLNADPLYGEVFMTSDSGSISVQNASITAGAVSMTDFGTSGSITVQNTSITTPGLTMTAGSTSGSITVQNSIINAPSVTMTTTSPTDSITVDTSSITTTNLTLNSGDGILLDGAGGLNGGGSGTVSLIAPANFNNPTSTLTVSNADFSSFSTVNMSGYTMYLTSVTFQNGSTVNLTSRNGGASFPATPSAATPGNVNFIGNNNKYGATPINAGTLNPSTLPNIHLNSTT